MQRWSYSPNPQREPSPSLLRKTRNMSKIWYCARNIAHTLHCINQYSMFFWVISANHYMYYRNIQLFFSTFTKVWLHSSRLLTSRFVRLKHLVRPAGLKKQIEHVRRLDSPQQETHGCVLLTFIWALQVLVELIILYQTATVQSHQPL